MLLVNKDPNTENLGLLACCGSTPRPVYSVRPRTVLSSSFISSLVSRFSA